MPNPGCVELADFLGDLGGSANGAVSFGGGPHVHRVADAERLGSLVKCALIAVADAREHEMRRSEAIELAARLLRRGLDRHKPLGEHLRRYGVGEPAVSEACS